MSNTLQITGGTATIQWGYPQWTVPSRRAATLRDWTVVGTAGVFTLTGSIVSKDDVRISQRPLVVITPNGWRWNVDPDTLQIAGTTLTASIRSQESPHVALSDCHT